MEGKDTMRKKLSFLFFLILVLTNCNDSPTSSEGYGLFAVYITDEQFVDSPSSLDEIELSDEALLTDKDISEYIWESHRITYTGGVHEKLKERGNLLHRLFVIAAEGKRIYWGKFMDCLDSGGCQNPVIILYPRNPDGRNTTPEMLVIDRAYPAYAGNDNEKDLRDDIRIYNALWKCGKLTERP